MSLIEPIVQLYCVLFSRFQRDFGINDDDSRPTTTQSDNNNSNNSAHRRQVQVTATSTMSGAVDTRNQAPPAATNATSLTMEMELATAAKSLPAARGRHSANSPVLVPKSESPILMQQTTMQQQQINNATNSIPSQQHQQSHQQYHQHRHQQQQQQLQLQPRHQQQLQQLQQQQLQKLEEMYLKSERSSNCSSVSDISYSSCNWNNSSGGIDGGGSGKMTNGQDGTRPMGTFRALATGKNKRSARENHISDGIYFGRKIVAAMKKGCCYFWQKKKRNCRSVVHSCRP